MDGSHVFPQSVLTVTVLLRGVIGIVSIACAGCEVGLPLYSVAVTILLGVGLLPSCWSRSPEGWV